jgi:hypothetical protein
MARRGRLEFYLRHIITVDLVAADGTARPMICTPLPFFWTVTNNPSILLLTMEEAKLVLKYWYRPPARPLPLMYGRGQIVWKVEYFT